MKSEKRLYQWDVNQYLTELQPTAEFIDYPIGNEVIRIKADGTRCRIPDEVLQTYGGKTCYERYPDGTFRAYSFTVLYAPKPPNYVFTPEERTTFEALTARVDAAIEEIKRRADSGEFTPVKGVDYFTDAEKVEMMESVSDGAIGEFRKVVDTSTTEYNDNHNLKLSKYNANASEKLTTYDTNAEQRTSDYNRNAEQKLEAYNQNHAAKVAEYNANAETKTAEFDSNAAVELEGKNLWDDSNPAFMQVLLNAGFLYNSGVWHTNNVIYSSVNIGTIPPQSVLSYDIFSNAGLNARIELFSGETRILPRNLESTGEWIRHKINIPSGTVIDRIVVDSASRGMCKIKNIQLERGTSETAYSPHTKQSITAGFPELHSAGTAHDEIDMDGGQVIRNVYTVEIGTLQWQKNADNRFVANLPAQAKANDTFSNKNNELCNTYESKTMNELLRGKKESPRIRLRVKKYGFMTTPTKPRSSL